MNNYTIYCTEQQAKRAIELGAPLIKIDTSDKMLIYGDNKCFPIIADYPYAIPTTDQMINWLEEQGFWYINISYYVTGDYWCYHGVTNGGHDSIGYNMTSYNSRKEATIAAIDAALDYLEKNFK